MSAAAVADATGGSEELLSKFTCAVCLHVLADPCSLTCGHTFDRFCLSRALAVKQQCPVCRNPCAPRPPEVNTLFRDALALLFPEELVRRGAELEAARAEQREQQRAEAARRAEEARQRAAAPPMPHGLDGHTTMFALFQVHAGGLGAPQARARREAKGTAAERAAVGRRLQTAALAALRQSFGMAPPPAAAAAAPPAAAAARRRRRDESDDAAADPPARSLRPRPSAEREDASGAAPARRTRAQAAAASDMPGLQSDSEDSDGDGVGDGDGMPPLLRAMLRDGMPAFHPGGGGAMLPSGMAAMLQTIQTRVAEELASRARQRAAAGGGDAAAAAAAAPGDNPFEQPMHIRFTVPDDATGLFGDGFPFGPAEGGSPPQPPARPRRRRQE